MKIFLCGQRTFGKEVCRALLAAGHEIVGVAPAPPQKRKDKLHGFAAVQGLPLVTDCKSLVSSFIPDGTELIVAAHSHWLISGQCLSRARYGGKPGNPKAASLPSEATVVVHGHPTASAVSCGGASIDWITARNTVLTPSRFKKTTSTPSLCEP